MKSCTDSERLFLDELKKKGELDSENDIVIPGKLPFTQIIQSQFTVSLGDILK